MTGKTHLQTEDFKTGLGQTIHTEEDQGMDKFIEVGQDMILIIGVIMETISEAVRGVGDKITMIIEGELLETKAMEETGVGHMIGKTEVITEGTIEVSVIVGQGQVPLEQVKTQIALDVLSAENMTICDRLPNDTSGERGRTNSTDVQ